MDTLKIKAILAAARHRSLSKAAEEFSYTPSAFSHMLAGFEEEISNNSSKYSRIPQRMSHSIREESNRRIDRITM